MTESEMAVWGGRFRFQDVSITRSDFARQSTTPGPTGRSEFARQTSISGPAERIEFARQRTTSRPAARLQERVSSAPATTQMYWKPRQPLRPKDHFVSPQPLIVGSSQERPCPLGCPCNQSDRVLSSLEPLEVIGALENCNRWCLPGQSHSVSRPTHMSSSLYRNNPSYRPVSQYTRPPVFTPGSHYSDLRMNPHCTPSQYNHQVPVRTQPIPPRNTIPVGWGNFDLTTVYHEHYTDPHEAPLERYFHPSYTQAHQQPQRPESPPRWETSYSAFCRNLLHVTRAF